MRIPDKIRQRLYVSLYERHAISRRPDFIVGTEDGPYLHRWWILPRNRWLNVYLHRFLRSDDDRALHDHPWPSLSVIMAGEYVEHTIAAGGVNVRRRYSAGDVIMRRAKSAHRIEIEDHYQAWTLFIAGPAIREWGFHCPNGWRHWREFVDGRDAGKVGSGCD
jgi:hypothetical protein